jgi:hypothetical protein
VEILLGLATILVHQPNGEHARTFERCHPQAARIIFDTPAGTPSDYTLGSTSPVSTYPSECSCEWEVVTGDTSPSHVADFNSIEPPQLTDTYHPTNDKTVLSPASSGSDDSLDIYVPDYEVPLPSPPHLPSVNLPTDDNITTSRFPESAVRSTALEQADDVSMTQDYASDLPGPCDDDIIRFPAVYYRGGTLVLEDEPECSRSDTPEHNVVQPESQTHGNYTSLSLVDAATYISEVILSNTLADADSTNSDSTWQTRTDEWNAGWKNPFDVLGGVDADEEGLTDPYKGPNDDGPGIFAYGPFTRNFPIPTYNYHIYLHPTEMHDVLEYFAYGGPHFNNGNRVTLHKLPISPLAINYAAENLREHSNLLQQIEAYIRGDPRFRDGVIIPEEMMQDAVREFGTNEDFPFFRFPLVEKLLSTLAARLVHPRLSHPFGRLTLRDIRHIVSPTYPVLQNPAFAILELQPPELPYIQAKYLSTERCHPEDTTENLTTPYFGCLRRYEAFLFQRKFPQFSRQLFHDAMATVQLIAIHADPATQPPPAEGCEMDWEQLLEPYHFADYFPRQVPSRVLLRACPRPATTNYWFPRAHYLLQIERHINGLIRTFETFFYAIGFEGLREIVDEIGLNREVNFPYSPILSYEQASYFISLYDFLLREHATFLACPILHLLHIPFPEAPQLNLVFDRFLDYIEPPLHSYTLYDDEDDEDISSSS